MKKILYSIITIVIFVLIISTNNVIAHPEKFAIKAKVYTMAIFDKDDQKYIQIIIQKEKKFISVIILGGNNFILSQKDFLINEAKKLRLGDTFYAYVYRGFYQGQASYIVDYIFKSE